MVAATVEGRGVLVSLDTGLSRGSLYSLENKSLCRIGGGDKVETIVIGPDNVAERRGVKIEQDSFQDIPQSKILSVFCKLCSHMSRDKVDNEKHVTRMHSTEKMVLCSRCPKVFTSVFEMKEHMKICMFYCSHCNFCDIRKSKVQSHQRKVHKYDSD